MTIPEQSGLKMSIYPPLRRNIFRHSLLIIGIYSLVSLLMISAIHLTSGITPKLIHVNYDSIAAAMRMYSAWNAIKHPLENSAENTAENPGKNLETSIEQFSSALRFEEGNITEPGEDQITQNIRQLWNTQREKLPQVDPEASRLMESYLKGLIEVNEKGMFRLALESNRLSNQAFTGSLLLFFLSILLTLYLADNLSVRIVSPIKELAETLKRKPVPGSELRLPHPNSLELKILTQEFSRLWERLSELQRLNLEEISSHRKRLEAVLSSVEDVILVLDVQERVVLFNSGILTLIELKSDELLDHRWSDLSTASPNYLKLRVLLKPDITSDQTVDLQVGQSTRTYSGRSRRFYNEKEDPIGRVYLLHDITEVRQRARMKEEFISVLSHELKTPLQSLGTAAELLMDRRSRMTEEEKLLIETISEDAGRIRAVANEFVQVGLVDLHSMKLKMEKVPMSELLVQWIQPFQLLGRDRNVKVELIREGSEVIFGSIDVVKFPWSVTNLVSNAIRNSPDGGTVTVYLTDRESRVDIEVRDEGPGIPEEIQGRIFDPYFQGDAGSSGFLGLGLTITREVVEAHDGRIEYFVRKPTGSIFRISLPLPE